MSFLQPLLLFGLPLALLPVIIHLIHQHRRRSVPWAATMFLLAAQQMNRGYSRLRRILILAFRVLALAALIAMIARPLAGGLLGLTGGAPDTVVVLLDRSASMEAENLATGKSKREAGIEKLVGALKDAYRDRSKLILIDSATNEAQALDSTRADALVDLPATWATDTASDIPGLLQSALDYVGSNQTGRTDVWLLSDLQQADWDRGSGRWAALRRGFTELPGVRFHLLCYPQNTPGNLAIRVDSVERLAGREKTELLLDLEVTRTGLAAETESGEIDVPIRFTVNGTTSVLDAKLVDNQLTLQGHSIPIDRATETGWGRVELPADTYSSDNVWHFVFSKSPEMRSVIVTDDPLGIAPVNAALGASADPSRTYVSTVLSPDRVPEIEWEEAALIVWHAPIPNPEENAAKQLETHVASGRSLVLIPPETAGDASLFGVSWGDWRDTSASGENGTNDRVAWWRSESGPLANTRDGKSLPVGELEVSRRRELVLSEGTNALPLARMEADNEALILQVTPETDAGASGDVLFLATPPSTGGSSLARDGVVLYVFLHRTLNEGAMSLGNARQLDAAEGVLGNSDSDSATDFWKRPADDLAAVGASESNNDSTPADLLPLRAGVVQSGDQLVALNRPIEEDATATLDAEALPELFAGLDHRVIEDTVEDESSLASEIWRTFLFFMAAALVLEALLSLPQKKDTESVETAARQQP